MKRCEPINLKLKSLLPQEERHRLDRYGYVVSHLYQARFSDNRWKELKTIGKMARKRLYTPMNSVLLRRILGTRHAKEVIDNLITWGVIESDNQYIPGSKSRSYRLTAQYRDSKYRWFNYSQKFGRRLKTVLEDDRRKRLTHTQRDIAVQVEQNFKVDMKVARKLLAGLKLDKLDENRNRLMLDRINDLDLGHSASPKTGRYFNLLVNLKRELRQAFVCDWGGKLVEVDIVNSQPFFFTALICSLRQKETELENAIEGAGFDVQKVRGAVRGGRFSNYIRLTTNGKFYDYLQKGTSLTRKEVKEEVFKTFFKRLTYTTDFEKTFSKLFPSPYRVMNKLKAMKGYNRFAILLQRIESYVIIEQLGLGLLMDDIPFFPVHDSFVVPSNCAREVKWIIESYCKGVSGVQPLVRIKKPGS